MAFPDAFFRPGTSKVYWVPTVADAGLAILRAEIDAGTDLSDAIQSMSGWSHDVSKVPLPNLGSREVFQLNGSKTYGDSSLTLYDDETTETIRDLLVEDATGYIVLFPYGDTATERCEVWPVDCDGPNDQWSLDGAAMVNYDFGISAAPARDVAIPA